MSKQSSLPVYKVKEFGGNNHKTVFFYCPFGIPSWQLMLPGLPIWRLVKNGYRVVAYSYGNAVATRSLQMTIDNIQAMLVDSATKITKLDESVQISCFGISMGTVLAANVTARHPRIKKVVLNLSYSDTAEHIINLPPIPTISRKRLTVYIKAGGGNEDLRTAFQPYAPLNLVNQLKNKRVLLYLSKTDRILQFQHTRQLRDALQANGTDLRYYENKHGGHFFAALYNNLHSKRYLGFLEQ